MAVSCGTKPGHGHYFLRELIKQVPDAPALTIAKKAYKQHPELWPSIEACRSMVRKIFGASGKGARSKTRDKSFFRKPRPAGWKGVIPESLAQSNWSAFEIKEAHRTLLLADIHIPFHDQPALETALNYGLKRNPSLLILNGDIFDHFAISRWVKDPRKRNFIEEVKDGKQFLKGLRSRFPRARIIFKKGNHEERYELFLQLKAPELFGLPEFEWGNVFGLDDLGIELVDQKRPIRLGKLNVLHGHEYVFQISNPVNPARGLFLRAKTHCIAGHFHQVSQHSERDLNQHIISTWSTGCLCDLHPDYRPLNPWSSGFAFVETDSRGSFHVNNLRIIDGEVY